MRFAFTLWDFGVWLSLNTIIILLTTEIFYEFSGKSFNVEKGNLRKMSIVLGALFFITLIIERFMLYNNPV